MNNHTRGFTSRRHPEPALLPLRAALKSCYSGSNKTISGSSRIFNKGFTLLEVLVVVLIIGILAAVAVPQYQKAVLKSRFSTVMPVAKAVADAQEVYFLGNGQYALYKTDLDITPMNVENTEVELSTAAEDENYNYVAAKRTDYPNVRYIIYQKHSPKFAGNIHCEVKATADEENEGVWLCRDALQGVEVNGSVQGSGYRTFILQGNPADGSFLTPKEQAASECAEKENCSMVSNGRISFIYDCDRGAVPPGIIGRVNCTVEIYTSDGKLGTVRNMKCTGSWDPETGSCEPSDQGEYLTYTCSNGTFDRSLWCSSWKYGTAGMCSCNADGCSCSEGTPGYCESTHFTGGMNSCPEDGDSQWVLL